MEDPRGKRVFEPLFKQMTAQMLVTFGGGQDGEGGIGMETMGFLMDMPLRDILYFQEVAMPMSPEDIVDGLLTQVSQTT